jgi:hypothetical protein
MAVPQMSDEQRAAALAKAAEARRVRAEMSHLLKTGTLTLSEVFERADTDDIVAGTKITKVILSLPGMGKVSTKRLLEEHEIDESRRIRGLGSRQRRVLLELFS